MSPAHKNQVSVINSFPSLVGTQPAATGEWGDMQTTGEEPQELEERAWACLGSGALASRAHQGASEPLEVTALWSLRGARRMGFQFQPRSPLSLEASATAYLTQKQTCLWRVGGESWLAPQEAQYTLICSLPSD